MRTSVTLSSLIVGLLVYTGCIAETEFQCPEGLQEVVRFELFFGLDHADGRSVSPDEWDAFMADTITPRFPQGLSALEVKGQWQRPDGVIERENTKLVMLVRPPPIDEGMGLINEISREYQRRFDQDPVFRSISQHECVGLYAE